MEAIIAGLSAKVIGAIAAVAAVMGVLFAARQSGKTAARNEQARKNEETRDAIDQARAAAPRDTAGVVERLRRRSF